MVRVGIVVEGQTEVNFVIQVLQPYLCSKNIFISDPVNLHGNVSIDTVRRDIKDMAYSYDYVTTLVDFYEFKGLVAGDTKESLENRIKESLDDSIKSKVIPYVQMYEFEGLLFSSPEVISEVLLGQTLLKWSSKILKDFKDNPEAINNSYETAPSKRLERHTNYKKTIHGPKIAKEIGMDSLRDKCANFNEWVSVLEGLV